MLYLKRNLPVAERGLRFAAALLLAALAYACLPPGVARALGLAAAAGAAATALVGFCPACALAGRRPLDR